jgi:hypothetical protein
MLIPPYEHGVPASATTSQPGYWHRHLVPSLAQAVLLHIVHARERAQSRGGTAMDIGPLTVESHPTPEDVKFLDDRLYE